MEQPPVLPAHTQQLLPPPGGCGLYAQRLPESDDPRTHPYSTGTLPDEPNPTEEAPLYKIGWI